MAPLFEGDRLETAARAVEARAGAEAQRLAAGLAATSPAPTGTGEAVARFAAGAIPPMTVVGSALEAALVEE